ncbi:MAG: response regulator transcription factor, partial [Ktedonobacterales bacterium]
AESALCKLQGSSLDCLLLDVMMPGMSGFELCRQIRETSDVPILFLSAKEGDADKIRGLGIGGDDYIVKSATPAEVVARVKAVLRRSRRAPISALLTELDFGRLVLDVRAHEVRVDGAPVSLPAREFELLAFLAQHPRQVFTREQLFAHFWGEIGDRHTVTVHIGRIRDKIEANPEEPRYIVTVWGVGYRFEGVRR